MGHAQVSTLRFSQNNTWLNDLDRNFMNLKESRRLAISGQELIEDTFVVLKKLLRKQVVEPFSGSRYFGESIKIPGSDHFTIAKPSSRDALQHRLLVQFVQECRGAATAGLAIVPVHKGAVTALTLSMSLGRLAEVTALLEELFQPISNRLKKDTAIWEGIKRDRNSRDSLEYKMAVSLEMKQIIPNHREVVAIIERTRHLVSEDEELNKVLDQYLRHVANFIAVRDAGEDWIYPELLGHPWPAKLIPLIEARLEALRKERALLQSPAT